MDTTRNDILTTLTRLCAAAKTLTVDEMTVIADALKTVDPDDSMAAWYAVGAAMDAAPAKSCRDDHVMLAAEVAVSQRVFELGCAILQDDAPTPRAAILAVLPDRGRGYHAARRAFNLATQAVMVEGMIAPEHHDLLTMPVLAARPDLIGLLNPGREYRVRTTILVDGGIAQVVDIERMTGAEWQACRGMSLSAEDTGATPGQRYRVELVPAECTGDETVVLDAYETTAE